MSTEQLVDKLTKAISFKYKEDKTVPGLTVASLKKGFYCSIVRYGGAFGKDKKVLCSAKADSLDQALKSVATKFLDLDDSPQNPVQELNTLVKGS
jgi:hypothetical protein